ncbi:hypothetical protein K1719_014322 [Acacia pycnantha]|nr:hypothetical protein K1719_014322 [Acacia pycnantha]
MRVGPVNMSDGVDHVQHANFPTISVSVLQSCEQFHQYQVVGRSHPTETDEHPKIYRMKLWANEVRAKSKFCADLNLSSSSSL